MATYEVCIVSKEYRWIDIEAPTEESARDQAWKKVEYGYTGDTKADDYDTEIFIEGIQR